MEEVREENLELKVVLLQLLEWQQALMLLLKDILVELQEVTDRDALEGQPVPDARRRRRSLSHHTRSRRWLVDGAGNADFGGEP